MDIAHAGIVAARNGKHVIRHVGPAMAHEGFQLIQMIRIDGDVAVVQFVHAALLFVVPRHFARRNRDDVARLGQRTPQRIVVRRKPQRQHTAGGKAACADVAVAIQQQHLPIAFVNHVIAFRNAVIRAQRIGREPYVAARLAAQLADHGDISFIRSNEHAAAKEIQNRAFGRPFIFPHNQAWKAADLLFLVMRLVVRRHIKAAVPVQLLNLFQQFFRRAAVHLLHTGNFVNRAER